MAWAPGRPPRRLFRIRTGGYSRVVPDAVVIGAGPNGLVCANLLADEGWDVLVLEAEDHPGGAVSSSDYLGEGWVADVCSAFYPLAAGSPVIRGLNLEEHGLRWRHAPSVLAHPAPDGRVAVLHHDLAATVEGLDGLAPGDGDAWARLYGLWDTVGGPLLDALFTPFPPVRPGVALARRLGARGLAHFARTAVLPVRRLLEEEFSEELAGLLVAGCSLHADLAPESAGSTVFGWLLSMLGQQVGFPVPEGGAGQLTAALVRRLEARGGRLECGQRVTEIVVRSNRAVGVRTAAGAEVSARRAVMAGVTAPQLYGGLVSWEHLPAGLRDDIRRFQWDYGTVKVDWALSGPIPWTAPAAGSAGTVHLADGLDDMTRYSADIATGMVPASPFVLLGQMASADPTRAPAGHEVAWGYTHVPRRVKGDAGGAGVTGRWDESDRQAMADRLEEKVERFAPGFRSLILRRHVMGPPQLEQHDSNLVGGAINGGTTSIHQQLFLRPTPGLGRPATPVRNLYLASSSAHPGGGVHGACGANAARAALRGGRAGRPGAAVVDRFLRR